MQQLSGEGSEETREFIWVMMVNYIFSLVGGGGDLGKIWGRNRKETYAVVLNIKHVNWMKKIITEHKIGVTYFSL